MNITFVLVPSSGHKDVLGNSRSLSHIKRENPLRQLSIISAQSVVLNSEDAVIHAI